MNIQDLIALVQKYLEPGQLKTLMVILAIAVPLYILINLSGFLDSFYSFRKRKQAVIKDYLDKDIPRDAHTEKAILDAREARYFKYIIGIYAEEQFRHALIQLHAKLSPAVDWRKIRKALRYLRNRDGQIQVSLGLSALIAYTLYFPLYFLVSYIILILVHQFFLEPLLFLQTANKIAYSLAYSVLFWVLLQEIWTINSAVYIWKKLNSGKTRLDLVKIIVKSTFNKETRLDPRYSVNIRGFQKNRLYDVGHILTFGRYGILSSF